MLNDKQLRALKPRERDYIIREKTQQRGTGRLLIKVKASGVKEFYYQYQIQGKQKRVKLGNYDRDSNSGISLAEARSKMGELSRIYQTGSDVKNELATQQRQRELEQQAQQRQLEAERKTGSFSQLLNVYVAYLGASNKSTTKDVSWSFSKYVHRPHAKLTQKKAKDITPTDVSAILRKMIGDGVTTYSNRVRSQLHTAFQFGLEQDNNPRTYLDTSVQFSLTFNPVSGVPPQSDWEKPGDRSL